MMNGTNKNKKLMPITRLSNSETEHDKGENLYLMMSKASNFENSNMFLIKLLPKDFLALEPTMEF